VHRHHVTCRSTWCASDQPAVSSLSSLTAAMPRVPPPASSAARLRDDNRLTSPALVAGRAIPVAVSRQALVFPQARMGIPRRRDLRDDRGERRPGCWGHVDAGGTPARLEQAGCALSCDVDLNSAPALVGRHAIPQREGGLVIRVAARAAVRRAVARYQPRRSGSPHLPIAGLTSFLSFRAACAAASMRPARTPPVRSRASSVADAGVVAKGGGDRWR
jgi:hypothetical protein